MTRRIPWARIIVEGMVIVASILLAFGIQAWWDERGEDQRREAILSGLASDFRATSEGLDRIMPAHAEGMAGAEALLRMTEAGAVDETLGPQVDTLLSLILWGGALNPPMGTLETLIATGSLDILENEALAQALTPWPAAAADLSREEDQNSEKVFELLALLAEVGVDGSDLAWHEFYPDVPWTMKHTGAWRVVGTPRVRTAISDLWFGYRSTTRAQRGLRERLDEVLGILSSH